MSTTPKPAFRTTAAAGNLNNTPKGHSCSSARFLSPTDSLYTQLTQLGLVTSNFDKEYRLNHRLATADLLRQLILIQKWYQGYRPGGDGKWQALSVRAMELNAHLVNNAGFGTYSNAAKINILYQLRRVLEKMLITHFGVGSDRSK
jgi:hypothetical protein